MAILLQVATLIALAVDVACAIMLYWDSGTAIQDAAGRGMTIGILVMTLGAMAAALMALAYSYMTSSTRAAAIALIVAAVPLVPVVLPALM